MLQPCKVVRDLRVSALSRLPWVMLTEESFHSDCRVGSYIKFWNLCLFPCIIVLYCSVCVSSLFPLTLNYYTKHYYSGQISRAGSLHPQREEETMPGFLYQLGWWLPLLITLQRAYCSLEYGQQENWLCLLVFYSL